MALTSPGLVAQEKNETGDDSADLTLDLPQDSSESDHGPATVSTTLELPLQTNEERVHQQEAAALKLDALSKSKTIPIVKAVPYVPPESTTVPITRPSFGHSAIADPRSDDYLLH